MPTPDAALPVRPPDGLGLPDTPISYDAFLDWLDEDTRAEWVDGDIVCMSPAASIHQRIVRLLANTLGILVEQNDLGELILAPFQMRLRERPSGREPDVLFVADAHRERIRETYLDGPADLVVEVLSPESGPRDRGDKFDEYEAAGIPEYWLIDPIRDEVTLWRLADDGHYRTVFCSGEGRVASDVVEGFWVRAEWFREDAMPTALEVLRTWGVVG